MEKTTWRETRPATWQAFNGHRVEGFESRLIDSITGEPLGEWRSEGTTAWHSDECQCDDNGASMGDW